MSKVVKMKTEISQAMTVNEFMALILADIEISLLMDKDQVKYKDKTYTKSEIKRQLTKTCKKVATVMDKIGYEMDGKLIPNPTDILNLLETI